MPIVPTYDRFQARQSSLPTPRIGAPEMPDIAGHQAQQVTRGLQQTANAASAIVDDVTKEANQLRVEDSLLKLESEANRLVSDKDIGFANLRGEAALKRPDGKPLTEEYGEKLRQQIDALSGELGNDQQRQMFMQRAGRIAVGFNRMAVQHEAREYNAYSDSVDDAMLENRKTAIGQSYTDKNALGRILHGTKDEKGNLVEDGMQQIIERKAKRHGMPAEWVKAQMDATTADAHRDVATRLMDENPVEAFNYIKDNADNLGKHYTVLSKAVRPAYDRAVGLEKGDAIYKKAGPVSADADNIIDWVISVEGGYVANDAGKGETKYGINKTANPDIDIKNLTPEQAKEIYRDRYWNGIGADKLPKEIRAIAFDTAVNQGVSTANRLLAASGGDPARMIELRRQEYASLIDKNPAKFKKYEKAWTSRLDQLAGLALAGGERSLTGQLREAERTIDDPEQRRTAMAHIKEQFTLDEAAKKEAYNNNFTQAMDLAYAKPGGWRDIAPSSWAQIKPEDRKKLMEPPKASDPDTLLQLMENPQLWKAGKIEQFRPLLAESDYRHFHAKGNSGNLEEKIRDVSIDNEQFKFEMQRAGLGDLLTAKKDSDGQKQLIELRAKFENVIDAEQQARGRKLSIDEKNMLLQRLIKPVKVNQVRTGSVFGLFDGPSEAADMRAFQVKNPANIRIPDQVRNQIIADMRARGITPTDQRVLSAYLATSERAPQ